MAPALLMVALLLFTCIILSRVGGKVGLPSLLLFICIGVASSALGLGAQVRRFDLTSNLSTIGLIFIIFYGGFGTNWKRAKKSALAAGILSTLGVVLTALLVMLFCHFALGMDWYFALLMGSIISSTDAASVFGILRMHRLNLRYGTASLLELESGSNDPSASIMVILALTLMRGESSTGAVILLILEQFGLGILLGFAVGFAAVWLMQHFSSTGDGYGVIFVTASALCAYAAAECIGGNGYLAVYLTGIVMGNSAIPSRRAMVHFFDGVTGLMQVTIFFLLGLVSTPVVLLECAAKGMLIALFLTFMARPVVILAILKPFHAPAHQRLVVEWCGLRGASAIVFAIIAAMDSATGPMMDNELFHTVFFIVLFSILLQGSLIPFVAKKLDMLDPHEDVMQTFSDWSEDVPMEFIQIRITAEHPWCNRLLMEVRPSQVLSGGRVVAVIRNEVQMTPRGSTRLQDGDILVASGASVDGMPWGTLNELTVSKGHEWEGKRVSELALEEGCSLVAILREGRMVIPDGNTVICVNDHIVMNESTN